MVDKQPPIEINLSRINKGDKGKGGKGRRGRRKEKKRGGGRGKKEKEGENKIRYLSKKSGGCAPYPPYLLGGDPPDPPLGLRPRY